MDESEAQISEKIYRSEDVNEDENAAWCEQLQEGLFFMLSVKISSVSLGESQAYSIDVLPKGCSSKWTVQRTYENFLDLEEFYISTITTDAVSGAGLVLPAKSEKNPVLFEKFLQHLLNHVGDYVWSCPRLLSFFDDSMNKPNIRDAHLALLTQKIVDLTTGYSDLENRLYNTQDAWNCLSDKLSKLEENHDRYTLGPQLSGHDGERDYNSDVEQSYSGTSESDSRSVTVNGLLEDDDVSGTVIVSTLQDTPAPFRGVVLAVEPNPPVPSTEIPLISDKNVYVGDSELVIEIPATGSPLTAAQISTNAVLGGSQGLESGLISPLSTVEVGDLRVSSASPVILGRVERTENPSIRRTDDGDFEPEEIVDAFELPLDTLEDQLPVVPKIHSYRNSRHLPISAISEDETSTGCDIAIDTILCLLTPHEDQLVYRASARAFLGRSVRHSLKAKLFETGLHALQTFLPDDPIRLTVLLWRGNSANWLANLSDKLKSLEQPLGAVGGPGVGGGIGMSNLAVFDDDSFNEANGFDVDNEPKPTGEHIISNISPSTTNGHSRMLCAIDAVPVEIVPNGRSDLCFLALVEEISQLVGKNNLFKRSLLLIRGWWTYETPAYVGVPTKNFFSDPVLCVLVSSIFNQYHAVIHRPLQALSIFLAEYSDIKWGDVAITLQGIVPFHSKGVLENQPWLREPLPTELVTSAILQKHCDFYHMSSTSNSNSRASATPRLSSLGETTPTTLETMHSSDRALSDVPEISMYRSGNTASGSSAVTTFENTAPSSVSATPYGPCSVSTAATVAAAAVMLASKASITLVKKPPSDSHCYSPTAVRNFQKRVINIVHPLTNANMISTSVTVDRVYKISHILETGACELHNALKSTVGTKWAERGCALENEIPGQRAPFDKFFRGILLRFNTGWRPDIFGSSLAGFSTVPATGNEYESQILAYSGRPEEHSSAIRNPSTSVSVLSPQASLESFFDQIRYMDLVLVGRVSESALLALSQDILVGRGVLPVGEIGKSLQDIAPTRNLSGKIKEKYGGLKKFLERYPDEVVICADHPFNPHVFLRKPLSAADLDLIGRGIIPPHLRKAMALRNKMRGGGTTIGALDGHGGPSPNNYSPGAVQGVGPGSTQMGPMGGVRHMGAGMNQSGLYSPHGNMNAGGQSLVMQNHLPVMGLRTSRNTSMVNQNQGFTQNLGHTQTQNLSQGNVVGIPGHLQSSHQQHQHQAYKPQQNHSPLGLGGQQGAQGYRNENPQGYRNDTPQQGPLSPHSQFSSQAHNQRIRDEMNSLNLMGGRGIPGNESRGLSITASAFNMPSNPVRAGSMSQGQQQHQHQYSQQSGLPRGNNDGSNNLGLGITPASLEAYTAYSSGRDRRALGDREREIHSLLLGERNDNHGLSQREGLALGNQGGRFTLMSDASGRRRYTDLAPGGLGLGDGNRDTAYNNERLLERKFSDSFRNQGQDPYRESQNDVYREQYRDPDSFRDQVQNDPYREDLYRDQQDSPSNSTLPSAFGLPTSLSSHSSISSTRGPSLSMLSAAKNFSERDKVDRMERDRERGVLSVEQWGDQSYSMELEHLDERERERDRYVDIDYGADVNSGLFSSLGGSSNQLLSDDNSSEYFDLRGQSGYQQSLNSGNRNSRSSYLRDLDGTQELSVDDELHQRLILQNQQSGLGQRQEYPAVHNQFDPSKWI